MRCFVLDGVLRVHDVLYTRYRVVDGHRRRVRTDGGGVHGKGHIPLPIVNGKYVSDEDDETALGNLRYNAGWIPALFVDQWGVHWMGSGGLVGDHSEGL